LSQIIIQRSGPVFEEAEKNSVRIQDGESLNSISIAEMGKFDVRTWNDIDQVVATERE